MYPHERSLVKIMADKPFALIGVNSDKDLDKLAETRKEKNITWRSFWNGEQGTRGPISTEWRVKGWPTTYLIDKDGVIRYKNVRGESLDRALEELMAEMGEEVSLVGVDHEALDEEAMKAVQAAREAEAAAKAEAKAKAEAEAKAKAEAEAKAKAEEKAKAEADKDAEKKEDSTDGDKSEDQKKSADGDQ